MADRAYRADPGESWASWARIEQRIKKIGQRAGEWCGIPMPLGDVGDEKNRLIYEPSYPWGKVLGEVGLAAGAVEPGEFKVKRHFWSTKHHAEVVLFDDEDGPTWGILPGVHHLAMDIHTLGCSDAWSLETESKAMETLRGLVTHRQMRQYLLTGMFIETSRRSRVRYIFRRLKPTVALKEGLDGNMKILACLCLHPIAYYERTWAGAMCPTDDVIAHLMLMRGDEHMFWKRANQIAPYRPEAGL